jgi:hypothetical protein
MNVEGQKVFRHEKNVFHLKSEQNKQNFGFHGPD